MNTTVIVITIAMAFLFGSIPTGYLLTKKLYNIDIRTVGSGNIGSTNVNRVVGRKISILTQSIDVIKGLIPVLIGTYIINIIKLPLPKDLYLGMLAFAAVLGHDYTPFLGFNGGKGVNTTLGAFFLLAPIPILSSVLIYFLLRFITSIVSIRSMVMAIWIPMLSFLLGLSRTTLVMTILASVLLIYRHKENIKRIINKEEK